MADKTIKDSLTQLCHEVEGVKFDGKGNVNVSIENTLQEIQAILNSCKPDKKKTHPEPPSVHGHHELEKSYNKGVKDFAANISEGLGR